MNNSFSGFDAIKAELMESKEEKKNKTKGGISMVEMLDRAINGNENNEALEKLVNVNKIANSDLIHEQTSVQNNNPYRPSNAHVFQEEREIPDDKFNTRKLMDEKVANSNIGHSHQEYGLTETKVRAIVRDELGYIVREAVNEAMAERYSRQMVIDVIKEL